MKFNVIVFYNYVHRSFPRVDVSTSILNSPFTLLNEQEQKEDSRSNVKIVER